MTPYTLKHIQQHTDTQNKNMQINLLRIESSFNLCAQVCYIYYIYANAYTNYIEIRTAHATRFASLIKYLCCLSQLPTLGGRVSVDCLSCVSLCMHLEFSCERDAPPHPMRTRSSGCLPERHLRNGHAPRTSARLASCARIENNLNIFPIKNVRCVCTRNNTERRSVRRL